MHQYASTRHDSDVRTQPGIDGVGVQDILTATQQAAVTHAVAGITARRESIDYVCGILMLIYRIDPDDAFEVLRWRSQESNVKLHKIADQLLADIRELVYDDCVPPRETFDRLLMTVHHRVRAD